MAKEIRRKSIEQNRAKFAWEYAEKSKESGAPTDKYKSHVREFPMLILSCGLVNAVSFAYEKGKISGKEGEGDKGWKMLYQHLEKWFKTDSENKVLDFSADEGLLKRVLRIPSSDIQMMRNVTNETISLFTWLKRFVS